MSATASSPADRWIFPAWSGFAAANAALMFVMPGEETVPFHFVWISLSLVYGLQPWSTRRTVLVLAVVCVVTGVALIGHVRNGVIGWEETTEVPLMTLVFLAMVMHVRRRAAAVNHARTLADSEYRMRDALRRFVRFASHELRTPLTVARGYTELIADAPDLEQVREDAGIVLDELGKLQRISARLLALAQVDEGSALQPEPVDLDVLLQQLIKRWRPVANRNWTVTTSAGTVTVDADRLITALDCLLENAVRYTQPGDRIGVEATRRIDQLRLRVIDTGTGIATDDLLYVFDAFRSGRRGRTGLGLAVVRAITEAHGGTVQAFSRLGVGSVFVLTLPADGRIGEPEFEPRTMTSAP